jgi:DNA invertase Pin-like site-specific DNA recombinase
MSTIPAAQYLRMSTERQEYSIDFQRAGIARYAEAHGFTVCRTYCDEARSGLDLRRRAGLSRLLQDVVGSKPEFNAVLVYDVSRWGRFQDPDEAAHYEFVCKAAGVRVHYCAELFSNNDDFQSTILKILKRVMAGEYSRELSQKVFEGLVRLVKNGFRTGAMPGYGFRRMLVSADGTPKQELPFGARKSIATDRVILIPAPSDEVFWVREIYRMFIEEGKSFVEIATLLKKRRVPFLPGSEWNDSVVKRILTHPKYKGTMVFNRTTEKLHSKSRRLPESEWILLPNAVEPLVTSEVFEAAQKVLSQKTWNRSSDELLEQLRSILKAHGHLSHAVLKSHGVSGSTIAYRFGSLVKAYALVGYETPHRKTSEHRLHSRRVRLEMMTKLVQLSLGRVSIFKGTWRRRTFLTLKRGPRVAVRVCRSINLARRGRVWTLQASVNEPCRVTLIAGMNAENTLLERFYVTGRLRNTAKTNISEDSGYLKHAIRLANLANFYDAVRSRRWSGV